MPRFGEQAGLFICIAPHLGDMRMARHRFEIWIGTEWADRRRKPFDVFEFHPLRRKRHHLVLQPCAAYRLDLPRRKRLRQIHAAYDSTTRRVLRGHSQLFGTRIHCAALKGVSDELMPHSVDNCKSQSTFAASAAQRRAKQVFFAPGYPKHAGHQSGP